MKLKLYYDPGTTMQALNYLASHAPDKTLDKVDALKLLFLADRDHLRKYSRTITGDRYHARKFGPVAVKANRLIEKMASTDGGKGSCISVARGTGRRISIRPRRLAEMDKLSQTDVESLDCALAQWPDHPDLVGYTHRFPEWRKHKAALDAGARSVTMDFTDFFLPCKNPSDEYCQADAGLVSMSREIYEEDSRWLQ